MTLKTRRTNARRQSSNSQSLKRRVKTPLNTALSTITDLLTVGDLEGAQIELQRLPNAEAMLATRAERDEDTMRAAMIMAEIHFAFGNDSRAQKLVKPYADAQELVLASSLAARQKLQLAEYHYSLFEATQAIAIATAVLERAEAVGDRRGAGESRFYLARASLRMNEYETANEHCMRGLEIFHRSDSSAEPNAEALTWQTGRLLRVRGSAMSWQGRLTEARAVLYLAGWLLRGVKGSRIHVGDALDGLGRILRSQGPKTYREAIDALEGAREHYRGHDLKLARTLTDLARTRQNMGLQQQRDGELEGANDSFRAADANLREALDLTDKHCGAPSPPIVWRRQKLDVLVWMSWLHQEATHQLDQAHAHAVSALALADGMPIAERVEAELALGHCELMQEHFDDALKHLSAASELAVRVPKLSFHAALCLAELEVASTRNIHRALKHVASAEQLLNQKHQFSNYLMAKFVSVKRDVETLAKSAGQFLFSTSDLFETTLPQDWDRIKMIRCHAEHWAVEAAISASGSATRALELLQIKKGRLRDIRKRYELWSKRRPYPSYASD